MTRIINIILIILAGEAVFILPFVLARIFRPTLLEVFAITNVQLGLCFSVYGVVALISYLFGGPLADRFNTKYLIGTGLITTAFGGLIFASFPSFTALLVLYGYWGFTSIFLLWAAMIKATRLWGENNSQALAYGLLDGGRGLVAAGIGSLGIWIFSLILTTDIDDLSLREKQHTFQQLTYIISALVASIGLLNILFLKTNATISASHVSSRLSTHLIKQLIKLKAIPLIAVIVVCAYYGYKTTDYFSLYASKIMMYNDIESAKIGSILLYARPVVGIGLGILGKKDHLFNWLLLSFLMTIIGSALFISGQIVATHTLFFIVSTGIISAGVYTARVLYFAIMEQSGIPLALTGTAVGLISVVGFTPDIFAGPLMGYFIDNFSGIIGFKYLFSSLLVASSIGLLTTFWLKTIIKSKL